MRIYDGNREAAEAQRELLEKWWEIRIPEGVMGQFTHVLRTKLAEAVPAKDYLQPHSEICQCGDCGWNECRRAFLGE